MTNCVQPSPSQESGSPHEPIFVNVYENSLGRAPVSSIQMMEQDNPIAHRLNSASQVSGTTIRDTLIGVLRSL